MNLHAANFRLQANLGKFVWMDKNEPDIYYLNDDEEDEIYLYYTNCLGFVEAFYKFAHFPIFAKPFPIYTSPYQYLSGSRDFPSPGHLAYVMANPATSFPYRPDSKEEAVRLATVPRALLAVRNQNEKDAGNILPASDF